MKIRFTSPQGRAALTLLCLVTTALAFWTGLFTMAQWDNLWSGGDYVHSYSIYAPMNRYAYMADQVRDLCQAQLWQGGLTYTDQQRLGNLTKALSPERTNYRFEIHDQAGKLLYSNLPEGESMDQVAAAQLSEYTLVQGDDLAQNDYSVYDEASELYDKMVYLADGTYVRCKPAEQPGEYNSYGWRSDGEDWWDYEPAMDTRIRTVTLTTQDGVSWPLTADDYFMEDYRDYMEFQQYLPAVAAAAVVTLTLSVALLIPFCRSAGRRRGQDGLVLNWQDRVPLDLYLCLFVVLITLLLAAGDSITYSINQGGQRPTAYVGLGVFTVATDGLCLALLHTLAVRCKAGGLFRNTVLWRLCARVCRFFREVAANWSVIRRPVLTFLLYLLMTVITIPTVVLVPVWQGVVLWLLCRWARQWRAVREGTARIVGGEPDDKIDTAKMYRDLREHAGQLNDLGSAIGNAVEERLKSERFKAELITNVSHDLKTPLTSIINYVDLLKKTGVEDPKALEYIEVLDRKSQRLKKLTEDLVEASKASTGALTVNKERLGFIQLLDQALGEYEEKFEKSGLSPVCTAPDHELYVEADGRHLWRVIDNLLGNCVKYAMPGTRVYLDVKAWDGNVVLFVKNVSREPLNIPADRLMERFVRGEESRTTEGSGLGLSIARSLTELQGGAFRLDIDGDLFKAVVSFPECRALTAAPPL